MFLFLFSSQAVRDPSGTHFSFLQIFCQNTEYWCWWNPGSLWYFLARLSTISCKTVRHKFHTSSIFWCFRPSWHWIIFYGDTFFTKRVVQQETVLRSTVCSPQTVLRSTVCSPQTSSKALRISVGVLPSKVSILMCDLWSSTVKVPEAPADAVSNTRQFKTVYTGEVTNTRAASSSIQL